MLRGQGFDELNTSITISKLIAVAPIAKALLTPFLDEEHCTMLAPSEHISGWKAALLTRSRTQLRASNEAVADRKREDETGKYCDAFRKSIQEPHAVYEMPEKRQEAELYGKDTGQCDG